jgi:hypothetical protein
LVGHVGSSADATSSRSLVDRLVESSRRFFGWKPACPRYPLSAPTTGPRGSSPIGAMAAHLCVRQQHARRRHLAGAKLEHLSIARANRQRRLLGRTGSA